MKVHRHDDQFDGHWHAWCGRGSTAVGELEFEATDPKLRCFYCDRDWFPYGQPDCHLKSSKEKFHDQSRVDKTV